MVMGRPHVSSDVGTERGRARRGVIPMNAADSVAEFKRQDRSSVARPYVRSGAQKLRWTRGLHHAFTRAVDELGGEHSATPKRILELMGGDAGVTLAHVKSHLQMFRIGKVNLAGMAGDPKPGAGDLTPEEQREVYIALQLLKAGRISGPALVHNVAEVHRFEALAPAAGRKNVETHEFISGLDSGNGRERRGEDGDRVELDLAVGTRLSSLKSPGLITLHLPSPSTPEEATLSLGLSVSR
jgi:SHAQKYF class myb-like DNA-binding protein